MKSWILGAALGAVVMFVWGVVFWAALPFAGKVIQTAPEQLSLQRELKNVLPETGTYLIPNAADPSDAEYQKLHKDGPIATIHIRKEGSEPMSPGTFMMGWLHEFVVLLIMGLVLLVAAVPSFGGRFLVVFLAGLAGSLFAQLAGPIWWLQPWPMAVLNLAYESVAWLLAALVLAFFIKPAGRSDASMM